MKKLIAMTLVLIFLLSFSAAAGAENEQKKIVATIFPISDWVREITGDKADVTLLLDKGVDLHSFQPTAQDIMKVATADVFIYIGGESDEWVEDALAEAVNPNRKVINLMSLLGDSAREEEIIEGMQGEEEEAEEDEVGPEYDEHIWLSLRNAESLVRAIAGALSETDPENGEFYRTNAEAYAGKLKELDTRYAEAVSSAAFDTVLFGDRFPFRYLADDYGLNYYAAFAGCSAETEASFETVIFLAQKVDELGLPAVLTIEGANHRVAETVAAATKTKDQKILTMDSLQGKQAEGETYLSAMENNLTVLREALNK